MTRKPLCIDLYCGLGGWTEGFLAEGYRVIGFDIEQHIYGDCRYPGQLVIQDVRTLHGSQFKHAAVIVASPPCQEYSYMAMPWTRAKQIARALRSVDQLETQEPFPDGYKGSRTLAQLTALFDACFRLQREASAAAGHRIPLVVENVKGAQPWVGKANWNFGSYYLWGDVPALMPTTLCGIKLGGGASWYPPDDPRQWFAVGSPGQKVTNQNPVHGGRVNRPDHTQVIDPERGTKGYAARLGDSQISRRHGSKSKARKAASAKIAKIPLTLARHIAVTYKTVTPGPYRYLVEHLLP